MLDADFFELSLEQGFFLGVLFRRGARAAKKLE